jgi:Ca2+-binding EF-hand superfamily protein
MLRRVDYRNKRAYPIVKLGKRRKFDKEDIMFRILLIAPLVAFVATCTEDNIDLGETSELGAVEETKSVTELEAQEKPCGKHGHFKHGGSVEERVAYKFDKLDSDKDGVITAEETKDHKWFSEKFAAADSDGDGKITKEELTNHVKERFENKDMPCGMGGHGKHGEFEGDGMPPCMKHGEFKEGETPPCMKGGFGHGGSVDEHVARKFEMLDADNDGVITAEEIKEHKWFEKKFAAADADSDGKITKEELTQFFNDKHSKKMERLEEEK